MYEGVALTRNESCSQLWHATLNLLESVMRGLPFPLLKERHILPESLVQRHLVPLNSHYDLCSAKRHEQGTSPQVQSLTAHRSHSTKRSPCSILAQSNPGGPLI